MRGDDQDGMFSYISFHKRVLLDHPLRWIRTIVDRVLEQLSPRFNKLYDGRVRLSVRRSYCGRCYFSCLYAVRSERLLMEQLNYHLFSLVRRAEPGDGV